MTAPTPTTLAEMTAELVAAYVAKNHIQQSELPALITSVHAALGDLSKAPEPQISTEPLKPAVPVRKSITDEYIISLEDGRKFKSMKRYLAGLGMTPDQYRAKWGLPHDYPMTAPAYAAKRSELAKTIGLGRKASQEAVKGAPKVDEEERTVEAQPEPKPAKKPVRRGKKDGE